MRHRLLSSVFALVTLITLPAHAAAETPAVVASIHPVESLVASVMAGVGSPDRLLPPGASPHSYALKPSEARMLSEADVVFWVGPDLETFLEHALESLTKDARIAALSTADSVVRLPARTGGTWEHGHEDEHDHEEEHGHGHEDDHAHGAMDSHMWLDPRNAQAWTAAIAHHLTVVDPANAEAYARNAAATQQRIIALEDRLAARLAGVKTVPYIVFHDAYQYFEHRFGLSPAGAVTVSPEQAPGARRVAELRDLVQTTNAACVFAEPQFEPRLVQVVVEGTNAATGVLDPLGTKLPPGPDLYFTMMENLADSLVACLTPAAR
ncbi:MAG: hypothetical protein VR70_15165 [Rhodospirillaceae bacterium BRH_c57]|nr:MAG: hypothetical protein VR70_15165 [Rhodospirillaceae bacterium BRH_c57]